jgi:hypothetical protein
MEMQKFVQSGLGSDLSPSVRQVEKRLACGDSLRQAIWHVFGRVVSEQAAMRYARAAGICSES